MSARTSNGQIFLCRIIQFTAFTLVYMCVHTYSIRQTSKHPKLVKHIISISVVDAFCKQFIHVCDPKYIENFLFYICIESECELEYSIHL